MNNWNETANFFLPNIMLFLLGTYGHAFFVWIHKVIATSDVTLFGVICTVVSALILLCYMRKIK